MKKYFEKLWFRLFILSDISLFIAGCLTLSRADTLMATIWWALSIIWAVQAFIAYFKEPKTKEK